ncbi:hypothetical protein N2152v2_002522 [Parachlorella kessleri]
MADGQPGQPPQEVKVFAENFLRYFEKQVKEGKADACVVWWAPNPIMLAQAQGRRPDFGDFAASPYGYAVWDLQKFLGKELAAGPLRGRLPCIQQECRGRLDEPSQAETFTTVNPELLSLLRDLRYGSLLDSLELTTFTLRRGVSRDLISFAQQAQHRGQSVEAIREAINERLQRQLFHAEHLFLDYELEARVRAGLAVDLAAAESSLCGLERFPTFYEMMSTNFLTTLLEDKRDVTLDFM